MPKVNDEVAEVLRELAVLTELDEGPQGFRVRAYQNAERAVRGLTRDVASMTDAELKGVRGLGSSTVKKIREYSATGTLAKLEELRERFPVGTTDLMRVPGLGHKGIELLRDVLGVTDLEGLTAAIHDGRLRDLPGMGEKTEENLLRAIERLDLGGEEADRTPIAVALPRAERLLARLAELGQVERIELAGSLRRFRETTGDIDLLVASDDPVPVMDAFCDAPDVVQVLGRGDTKSSVVTRERVQVDLRVVPPDRFGAALVYFTGSKAHNIRLRERALKRDVTLNEYGLAATEDVAEGEVPPPEVRIAGATEEEVYAALDLAWITPELREDAGEIELAEEDDLPDLVEVDHLRGDLHDHSDWSGDGRASMADMVAAAAERGLDYLALTDHAENLTINGLSRKQMLDQRRQLQALAEQHPELTLLHGAELNIGVDGSLDYDDEFLTGFEWCVASVHSSFQRPVADQTARVVTAIRNPAVNVIGHLHGRRVGKRPGIELDLEQVFDAAVETGTGIEVNSNLDRLDAPAEAIREGVRHGVTFVISTDAHAVDELDYARHGVRQARRGGLGPDTIANTWPTDRFLDWARAVRKGA